MFRACPAHSAQVAATAQGRSCPLCAQVVATAQGSRESEATAARTQALQTRACPSHPPQVSAMPPRRNASKQELLLGLGHQVGLRGLSAFGARCGAVGRPCFAFTAFTVVSPPAPAYGR